MFADKTANEGTCTITSLVGRSTKTGDGLKRRERPVAHSQQIAFCQRVKALLPQHFTGKRVLDCGALDINGNNRYLFTDCEYTGIDVVGGPNVDIVVETAKHTVPDGH